VKRGTTTPLLPPSSTTGVEGLEPEFHDIIDIIEDIWEAIAVVEEQMSKHYNKSLETKLNYYYDLSEYWEDVYLTLVGKRIYESFF